MTTIIRSSALAALALAAATGCSTASSPAAPPTTTPSKPVAVATSTGFPTPPPYTVEVDGNQINVSTGSAAESDLRTTYNTVARTLRPTLADGGYWVRINCANAESGEPARLATGTIGIGKKGLAVHGDFGSFTGAVPGAHCP